ncbi:MAG: hypothetical protein ABIJ97_01265 [Bacteroidota bacterium]
MIKKRGITSGHKQLRERRFAESSGYKMTLSQLEKIPLLNPATVYTASRQTV